MKLSTSYKAVAWQTVAFEEEQDSVDDLAAEIIDVMDYGGHIDHSEICGDDFLNFQSKQAMYV